MSPYKKAPATRGEGQTETEQAAAPVETRKVEVAAGQLARVSDLARDTTRAMYAIKDLNLQGDKDDILPDLKASA